MAQFQAGDELWWWARGEELASTIGYVIIRNGQPIDYIATMRS